MYGNGMGIEAISAGMDGDGDELSSPCSSLHGTVLTVLGLVCRHRLSCMALNASSKLACQLCCNFLRLFDFP